MSEIISNRPEKGKKITSTAEMYAALRSTNVETNAKSNTSRAMRTVGIIKGQKRVPPVSLPSMRAERGGQDTRIVPPGSGGWGSSNAQNSADQSKDSDSMFSPDKANTQPVFKPLTTMTTTLGNGTKSGQQKPFFESFTNSMEQEPEKPVPQIESKNISGTGGASELVGSISGWAAADQECINFDEEICFSDEEPEATPKSQTEVKIEVEVPKPLPIKEPAESWRSKPSYPVTAEMPTNGQQWAPGPTMMQMFGQNPVSGPGVIKPPPPYTMISIPLLLNQQQQVVNPIITRGSHPTSSEDDCAMSAAQRYTRLQEKQNAIRKAREKREKVQVTDEKTLQMHVQNMLDLVTMMAVDPTVTTLDPDVVWKQYEKNLVITGVDIVQLRATFDTFFSTMMQMVNNQMDLSSNQQSNVKATDEEDDQQGKKHRSQQSQNFAQNKHVPSLMDLETQPSSEHLQDYWERDFESNSRFNSYQSRGASSNRGGRSGRDNKFSSSAAGSGRNYNESSKNFSAKTFREEQRGGSRPEEQQQNWRASGNNPASAEQPLSRYIRGAATSDRNSRINAPQQEESQETDPKATVSQQQQKPKNFRSGNAAGGSSRIFNAATAAANASCSTADDSKTRNKRHQPPRFTKSQMGHATERPVLKDQIEAVVVSPPSSGASTLARGSSTRNGGSNKDEDADEWETATEGSGVARNSLPELPTTTSSQVQPEERPTASRNMSSKPGRGSRANRRDKNITGSYQQRRRKEENPLNEQEEQPYASSAKTSVSGSAQYPAQGGGRGPRVRGTGYATRNYGSHRSNTTSNYGSRRRGGRNFSGNKSGTGQDEAKSGELADNKTTAGSTNSGDSTSTAVDALPKQLQDLHFDDGSSSVSGGLEFIEVRNKRMQKQQRRLKQQQQQHGHEPATSTTNGNRRQTGGGKTTENSSTRNNRSKPVASSATKKSMESSESSQKSSPSHPLTANSSANKEISSLAETNAWTDATKTISVLFGGEDSAKTKPINAAPGSREDNHYHAKRNNPKKPTTPVTSKSTKPQESSNATGDKIYAETRLAVAMPATKPELSLKGAMPPAPIAAQTSPNNVCKVRPQQQFSGNTGPVSVKQQDISSASNVIAAQTTSNTTSNVIAQSNSNVFDSKLVQSTTQQHQQSAMLQSFTSGGPGMNNMSQPTTVMGKLIESAQSTVMVGGTPKLMSIVTPATQHSNSVDFLAPGEDLSRGASSMNKYNAAGSGNSGISSSASLYGGPSWGESNYGQQQQQSNNQMGLYPSSPYNMESSLITSNKYPTSSTSSVTAPNNTMSSGMEFLSASAGAAGLYGSSTNTCSRPDSTYSMTPLVPQQINSQRVVPPTGQFDRGHQPPQHQMWPGNAPNPAAADQFSQWPAAILSRSMMQQPEMKHSSFQNTFQQHSVGAHNSTPQHYKLMHQAGAVTRTSHPGPEYYTGMSIRNPSGAFQTNQPPPHFGGPPPSLAPPPHNQQGYHPTPPGTPQYCYQPAGNASAPSGPHGAMHGLRPNPGDGMRGGNDRFMGQQGHFGQAQSHFGSTFMPNAGTISPQTQHSMHNANQGPPPPSNWKYPNAPPHSLMQH